MNVLILGVNGFIGHHLSTQILAETDWSVYGMDMSEDRLENMMGQDRFHFFEGDLTINREWIAYHVKKCDVILPLVAIATPATYVTDPLGVFELDFEANLEVVRSCVRHGKRVVFPSTSEVYGKCLDERFDPYHSDLVLGPICKPRWIYACAKQLLDRVIAAYGQQQGLQYTLFRPFNWIGSGLDNLHSPKEGSSRVVTQFLGQIVRGEDIKLVDGGKQRRCFTDIADGIAALMTILENPQGVTDGKIYNIGNPANDLSIRELAETMLMMAKEIPEYSPEARQVAIEEIEAEKYYGDGYQDVINRVPDITNTCEELNWQPRIGAKESLERIFDTYRYETASAGQLLGNGRGP